MGQRGVSVRSYRGVVDDVERRVYRIDRWRLPNAGGIPARAIGYAAVALVAIAFAGSLPIVGWLLGAVPAPVRLVAMPIVAGWALSAWRIDGRSAFRALVAGARWASCARELAGLRRCPAVGSERCPLEAITIAPSGDGASYRRGRVRGPASLVLRYPAEVSIIGASKRRCRREGQLAGVRRVVVTTRAEQIRPLPRARTLRVPRRRKVVFR